MSWTLEVLGWLGMVPVFAVAASATLFGAGLPLVLVLGVLGRGSTTGRRATAAPGRDDARRGRSAA